MANPTDKKVDQQKPGSLDTTAVSLAELQSQVANLRTEWESKSRDTTISSTERQAQEEVFRERVDNTRVAIQGQIDRLQGKTDAKSLADIQKAETLLSTLADTLSLQSTIGTTPTSTETKTSSLTTTDVVPTSSSPEYAPVSTTEVSDDKKKGFFGRAGQRMGEQWDALKDPEKRRAEPGATVARALGVGLTGYALFKGVQRAWNKIRGKKEDKKESKEKDNSSSSKDNKDDNKSWWRKFLVGTGIAAGTVFGGVEIYKNWNTISSRVKEKLGLALNFNEALAKVESEVKNGKVDTKNFGTFRAHFEGMSYDESTQEISSFGEKTKIDKRHKQIAGLDGVQFASWEELFHAVNIVNFAKKELKGKGATNKPFIKNDTTGDIDFTILGNGKRGFISANGSDFWTKVLGASGAGAGGLLGGYALGLKGGLVGTVGGGLGGYALGSIIDNTSAMGRACGTIAKGANLDRFILYLNNLNIWKGEQEVAELDKVSPIYPYFNEVKEEFKAERVQDYQRNLSFEYDDNNPSEVLIQSYGQLVKLKLEGNTAKKGENLDFSKITKISILRYSEDNNSEWDCDLDIDFPHNEEGLKEAIRVANFTNMIRDKYKFGGRTQYPFGYLRYVGGGGTGFDMANKSVPGFDGSVLLSCTELNKKYPTLHKDLKKSTGIISIGAGFGTNSNQNKQHNRARQDSSKGSQYIKYLHQMSEGMYRWNKAHND